MNTNQTLQVSIGDNYNLINGKDIQLSRTITYFNNSPNAIPLSLSSWQIRFPSNLDNSSLKIVPADIQFDVLHEEYSFVLRILSEDFSLGPNSKWIIKIQCNFKNYFIENDLRIRFSWHERCVYHCTVNGLPDQIYYCDEDNKPAILGKNYSYNNGSFNFLERELDPSFIKIRSIEIYGISTVQKLPTLSSFIPDLRDSGCFKNKIILLIQHLLNDFIHVISALEESGANKNHIVIVGIPYSTKEKVAKFLKNNSYTNIYAPSKYDDLESNVRDALNICLDLSKDNNNMPIIVIEDGGYAVPIIHKEFSDKSEIFLGAVEQTTNGIKRDENLKSDDNLAYLFPIGDVARSDLKNNKEAPLIGSIVIHNLRTLLRRVQQQDINGKNIIILGYGVIAKEIYRHLKNEDVKSVRIFGITEDIKEARGHQVEVITDLPKALSENSLIIIGATGNLVIGEKEIVSIGNNIIFASASSKKLEIDYSFFDKYVDKSELIPQIGTMCLMRSGNRILLLAEGHPINFFNSESVADSEIDFIPTLLLKTAQWIITDHKKLDKGILQVPQEIQMRIEKEYEKNSSEIKFPER